LRLCGIETASRHARPAVGFGRTVSAQPLGSRRNEKALHRAVALSSLDLEALLLHARGRIRLPVNLAEWLAKSTTPMREASFTHEIVLLAQQLPLPHRDPADRFLAATAQVMDLTLVTGHDRLLGLGTHSHQVATRVRLSRSRAAAGSGGTRGRPLSGGEPRQHRDRPIERVHSASPPLSPPFIYSRLL
jgi:PIN domain nuclease of toxin-antitoxin system